MDGFLLVIVAMFAMMYLLLIRPQRQQQRRHTQMIEGLKPGDEVITAGGIYGDVTEVQADRVSLEIAEDVEIEVAKRAIASVVPPEDEVEPEDEAEAEDVGAGHDRPVADEETEPETVPEEDAARR